MDFAEAFGSDVTPRDFFVEKLPALHESRRDQFALYCETTLRISVKLEDLGEQYTVELMPDGARAREGDMIDFPVVTIEGTSEHWETVKEHAREIFEHLEGLLEKKPPRNKITRDFLDDLERYDAVVNVELDSEDFDDLFQARLILNDYEPPPGAREVTVRGSADLMWQVLEGEKSASEASNALELSDDLGLAFNLGGLIMNHFPELDD